MKLSAAVLVLCFYRANCEVNYTRCDQDITALERALYTPNNIKELNKVFYPPRETPSRFIKVTYKFDGHDCTVTYIWAIGGFLLMQPPKIFQLTSLYFSTIANDLTDLVIQLPDDCWPLVEPKKKEDGDCTCQRNNNILDILTQQVRISEVAQLSIIIIDSYLCLPVGQVYETLFCSPLQLNVYAKYSDTKIMVRDTTQHVQAICDSELKKDYFSKATNKLFMVCTMLIPVFFIITISTIARSFHEEINKQLALKQNHGNFAAIIIIGIFAQGVIVGIDSAAIYYVLKKQYEYSMYDVQHTINCYITLIAFSFDTGIGVIMLLCLLYLWCTLCHRDSSHNCKNCLLCNNLCLEICLPCFLLPFFYAIFGPKNKKEFGTCLLAMTMPTKIIKHKES